jgi:hypothetical protein
VRVEGREVELTNTEFELLRVLGEHPGWVYSREDLLESVWGYSYLGDSRLVDVHIANLRKKIGDDPSDPHFIRTVRGVGYKFQPGRSERPLFPRMILEYPLEIVLLVSGCDRGAGGCALHRRAQLGGSGGRRSHGRVMGMGARAE